MKKFPSWHTEAVASGIDYIVIVYCKAEGFVFCPTNLDFPFRVGGDYNGNAPVTAEHAFDYYHQFLNDCYEEEIKWFIKYVEMVYLEEDFSLSDIEIEKRNLRTITGRWPW